jgi:hypothetical protein
MPFIGNKPAQVPLTSADIADGIITSAKIVDGTIVNADINASAAIVGTKLSNTGGLKSMQVFSTAGSFTYTKPSGINLIKVYVTGGGGGGGKGGSSETSGGGGGAGGTAIKVINATSITTETVTIGAGGASETAGSTSSFGSHCSATGGEQGLNAGALAGDTQGGVGSSGDINLYGQAGGGGADDASAKTGGLGGSSFWGGGGYGIYNTTGLVGYHGGGGGGGQRSTANLGGAGGAGICVVEEYS